MESNNSVPQSRIQQRNVNIILSAAMDVIAEFGFHGTTIGKVAKKSGISRTNIHYYYPTRNDLIMAAIVRVNEDWYDAFRLVDANGDPGEELMKYVTAKLKSSFAHPRFSQVFISEIMAGAPLTKNYIKNTMRRVFRDACQVLQKWIDEGKIIDVAPEHIFFMIWAMTQYYADHETAVKLLLDKRSLGDDVYDAALETISAMIVKGLIRAEH